MLTKNIWVEKGLVNGARGYVRDIIWPEGTQDPRTEAPKAILVAFDGYDGPSLVDGDKNEKVVPIFRSKREWNRGAVPCSRT